MPGVTFARGDRVTLRTIEREDLPFVQRGYNHPGVRGSLGLPEPVNAKQVEERFEEVIETDDSANLLVCQTSTDDADSGDDGSSADDDEPTAMGMVNAWNLDRPRPRIAYWLLPAYQGEGYATEAVALLIDHVFDTYEACGVEAGVFSHNDASQALLDRLGFAREGELRKNQFVEGAYRDEYVYGLLREEWVEDA